MREQKLKSMDYLHTVRYGVSIEDDEVDDILEAQVTVANDDQQR